MLSKQQNLPLSLPKMYLVALYPIDFVILIVELYGMSQAIFVINFNLRVSVKASGQYFF